MYIQASQSTKLAINSNSLQLANMKFHDVYLHRHTPITTLMHSCRQTDSKSTLICTQIGPTRNGVHRYTITGNNGLPNFHYSHALHYAYMIQTVVEETSEHERMQGKTIHFRSFCNRAAIARAKGQYQLNRY